MNFNFWFVVGSQDLYGEKVMKTVAQRAEEMAQEMSKSLPYPLIYKVTAMSNAQITRIVKEANYDDTCAGIITWCHTFSPSKMWINGLANLQKPYCHFATQYNKEIPNDEIDMDFMNLNQAAHGDREHGFIAARLRMPRKVIAGYWKNENVLAKIGSWMKAAVGVAVSKNMKVMRFGDNMREVAVTEGDKVEVQTKLGWQVNTWAVGDLVKEMNAVSDAEIDALMAEYTTNYDINTPNIEAIRYQAREEIAMKKMLDANGFKVEIYKPFADDLHGSSNLPADRLTLYMANNEQASNQTVVRINWCPKHALDMPRFINEEVSVFVSLASPYNLQDVPMIRTYVNAYTATRTTIRLAIEKLMGKSEFKGVSPVDAFCGLPDTNL